MAKDQGEEQEPQEEQQPPQGEVLPVLAETSQGRQDNEKLTRQRGPADSFTGRAAQLAVMAELLWLRCNVAIPEVDLGTDVFVFNDDREEVVRLQVKSCTSPYIYADGSGYSARFVLPVKQLNRMDDLPPLFYALAVMSSNRWVDFLVVSRARLQSYYNGATKFGSFNKDKNELTLTIQFREAVHCNGQTLTDCRNAWKSLPPLLPIPDLESAAQDEAVAAKLADAGTPPPPAETSQG